MKHASEPWFAPKRFGYGSGFPIAWQGWAVLAGYIAIVLIGGLMVEWDEAIGRPAAALVIVPATIALVLVAKARTRGGWRWRWGETD